VSEQSNALALKAEAALVMGDLSKLTTEERMVYYKNVCDSVGLNPLTRPFDYLVLNGKTVLYAKRDCTDQLRKIHSVSVQIVSRETVEGILVVTAKAMDKTGRVDESTGAVSIAGLKGDMLANAFMKCETKAKRRVTLSLCGLGMLDETEIETIPQQRMPELPAAPKSVVSELEMTLMDELNRVHDWNSYQHAQAGIVDEQKNLSKESLARLRAKCVDLAKRYPKPKTKVVNLDADDPPMFEGEPVDTSAILK